MRKGERDHGIPRILIICAVGLIAAGGISAVIALPGALLLSAGTVGQDYETAMILCGLGLGSVAGGIVAGRKLSGFSLGAGFITGGLLALTRILLGAAITPTAANSVTPWLSSAVCVAGGGLGGVLSRGRRRRKLR